MPNVTLQATSGELPKAVVTRGAGRPALPSGGAVGGGTGAILITRAFRNDGLAGATLVAGPLAFAPGQRTPVQLANATAWMDKGAGLVEVACRVEDEGARHADVPGAEGSVLYARVEVPGVDFPTPDATPEIRWRFDVAPMMPRAPKTAYAARRLPANAPQIAVDADPRFLRLTNTVVVWWHDTDAVQRVAAQQIQWDTTGYNFNRPDIPRDATRWQSVRGCLWARKDGSVFFRPYVFEPDNGPSTPDDGFGYFRPRPEQGFAGYWPADAVLLGDMWLWVPAGAGSVVLGTDPLPAGSEARIYSQVPDDVPVASLTLATPELRCAARQTPFDMEPASLARGLGVVSSQIEDNGVLGLEDVWRRGVGGPYQNGGRTTYFPAVVAYHRHARSPGLALRYLRMAMGFWRGWDKITTDTGLPDPNAPAGAPRNLRTITTFGGEACSEPSPTMMHEYLTGSEDALLRYEDALVFQERGGIGDYGGSERQLMGTGRHAMHMFLGYTFLARRGRTATRGWDTGAPSGPGGVDVGKWPAQAVGLPARVQKLCRFLLGRTFTARGFTLMDQDGYAGQGPWMLGAQAAWGYACLRAVPVPEADDLKNLWKSSFRFARLAERNGTTEGSGPLMWDATPGREKFAYAIYSALDGGRQTTLGINDENSSIALNGFVVTALLEFVKDTNGADRTFWRGVLEPLTLSMQHERRPSFFGKIMSEFDAFLPPVQAYRRANPV